MQKIFIIVHLIVNVTYGVLDKLQICSSPVIKSWDGDRKAVVPSIVKSVYLLRTKSCARFGLDFSILLLCQVENPDKINTRNVYLLVKNIKETSDLLTFTAILGLLAIQSPIYSRFSNHIGKKEHRIDIIIFSSIYSSIFKIDRTLYKCDSLVLLDQL